jgi:hypothetical protein
MALLNCLHRSRATASPKPHFRTGSRRAQGSALAGIGVTALLASLLSGCGSGASAQPPTQSPAVRTTCQQVNAVLSDGPDPGADPVGYALAQVLPLRQIHTSDGALHVTIDDLASAYEEFYSSNGDEVAAKALSKASDKVNAICPGAAS